MINFTPANNRIWSRLGPCGAFGLAAFELPEINDKTMIVTADMRLASGLNRFLGKYPERLFNVGIAEQNLLGVAAGLAKEGFSTFATTYATFATMRAGDQVKVNMGYMGLPIKLVGLLSGFAVSTFGATHFALEDISVMRTMPNVTIVSPADCASVVKATLALGEIEGPAYLRLTGTMNNPIVYNENFNFEIGKAIKLKDNGTICIIATGSMVHNALKAAEELEELGLSAEVFDMHTIAPLDMNVLENACSKKLIVTVEEHGIIGGLGSCVAEFLSDKNVHPPLLRLGARGPYPKAGDYQYALEQCGLTIKQIVNSIAQKYKETRI